MFSGDHVMGWSTPIVAPPDGAMSDYMDSLHKLAQRTEPIYLPGHGGAVRDAPRFVAGLHPAPQGARGLDPAPARQGRDRHPDHRARGLYRARSAADAARPAYRCWRIWRIWWRAARSRPTARPRSAAFIGLAGLTPSARVFFGLLRLLGGFSGVRLVDRLVDRPPSSAADARRVGAEVVAAVARGRADIDRARRRDRRGCAPPRRRGSP